MTTTIVFDAYGTLFDVQALAEKTEALCLGYGNYVNALWRMKQLEYSWLRSLLKQYVDFDQITLEALTYAVATLRIKVPAARLREVAESYDRLQPYRETPMALDALSGHRLAILSNGSQSMLDRLVANSGLSSRFEAVISVDEKRTYKPDPVAYALVEERLKVARKDVVFVSANGFDVAGARNFGFRVVRVERMSPERLSQALVTASAINFGPSEIYAAMRSQEEGLGLEAHHTIPHLGELINLLPHAIV